MNYTFGVAGEEYDDKTWLRLFYQQELYWMIFDVLEKWKTKDRRGAIRWFAVNIPVGSNDLLTGFQNLQWWQRLISIILKNINYRRMSQNDKFRLVVLSEVFEIFNEEHVYLDLKEIDIETWMVRFPDWIIEGNTAPKSREYESKNYKRQVYAVKRKYESCIEFKETFVNLFARIYFYGQATAVNDGEDAIEQFEREIFFEHVFINNFPGFTSIEDVFAELCVEIYAAASFEIDI